MNDLSIFLHRYKADKEEALKLVITQTLAYLSESNNDPRLEVNPTYQKNPENSCIVFGTYADEVDLYIKVDNDMYITIYTDYLLTKSWYCSRDYSAQPASNRRHILKSYDRHVRGKQISFTGTELSINSSITICEQIVDMAKKYQKHAKNWQNKEAREKLKAEMQTDELNRKNL